MSLRRGKGPESLECSSMSAFHDYLLSAIHEINEKCLCAEILTQEELCEHLRPFKEYLRDSLYPRLIDQLLCKLNADDRCELEKQMLLEVFMHDNMVRFNPSFRVMAPSPADFYENKISRFANIVELNLKMAATDAILSVVGRSCPNLQVIDIVSKIGTLRKHYSRINALRLEFYVSDDGLMCLHACKKLRRIIMRKIVGSNCGGKLVTYNGIRGLLMALPNLQYIRYNNMGYVIDGMDYPISKGTFPDDRDHFNLHQLHDDHTSVEHIEKMGKLCPKLKTLCLNVPPDGLNTDRAGEVLESLTTSELALSAVSLRGFMDDEHLTKFCQIKGEALGYLKFHSVAELSITSLITIGQHCPNMISLDYVSPMSFEPMTPDEYGPHTGKYFHKLEALTVTGLNLDLNAVFSVCCHRADYLEYIQIISYGYTKRSHSALRRLMDANRLHHLKSLICCGFEFNMDDLLQFLIRTTSLEQVAITEESSYEEYLKDVKVRHNLHYSPVIDIIPSRSCCFCYDYNVYS